MSALDYSSLWQARPADCRSFSAHRKQIQKKPVRSASLSCVNSVSGGFVSVVAEVRGLDDPLTKHAARPASK